MRRRVWLVVLVVVAGCSGGAERTNPSTTTTAAGIVPAGIVTTAPAGEGEPVVSGFVAFGDFGGGSAQYSVAAAMERWVNEGHRVDALVTTGDNVYEVARPELFAAQLDEPYQSLRASRPMWATLGNHDVAGRYGDEELSYLGLPLLPYAKELPGVQLLFLDANRPDEAQTRWLEERLREPRPDSDFRVVIFHQPAYSCGLHGSTEAVMSLWVPVLERERVDLVLNGHDHDYQRFRSGAGVNYVVTGGGGRDLYPLRPLCGGTPPKQASAVRHHFVGVEVRPGRLTLTAVADDSSVIDTTDVVG